MRATRTSWKTYALGAAAVTALLSATACGPDSTDKDAGSTPSATPSASLSAQPGTSADSSSQDSGTSSAASGDSAGSTGSGSSGGGTAACSDANTSIAATVYTQDSNQHLLLTATNTGDKACALYRYPVVRFDSGRKDQVGPMESAMKGATIGAGAKAYAGMLLFRVDAPTDAVKTVTVSLQGRVSNADADSGPIKVSLPAETPFLNIDHNPLVSYWNTDRKTTEGYMFKAAGGN